MLTTPNQPAEKDISNYFWLFIGLHFLCWTLLPSLVQPNTPLDVVEGFAWGDGMQWGYYKHPPLQAWLLQLVWHVFGNSGFGYFGLSAACTSIALWAVYRTARLFTTKPKALVAALLCEGIVYFNYLSTEFNPNVLQLVTWALCSYAFARAILRNKWKHWLLLGLFFAVGFYAKYAIALLALGFGLFILFNHQARHALTTPQPYISLAIFAALVAPHVWWLIDTRFLPFAYALSRSEEAPNIAAQFYYPIKFTFSQMLDMVPMFALVAMLFNIKTPAAEQASLRKQLLHVLAFAPLVLNFIISVVFAHRPLDMWGMPYLSFIPLWFVMNAPLDFSDKALRGFGIAWGCVFCLSLGAFYVAMVHGPAFGFKPMRGLFPGTQLSKVIHDKWQQEVGTPLEYVIGDAWSAGNVALYSPQATRPHVFIDGYTEHSPWIDETDLNHKGAVVIWLERQGRPAYLPDASGPVEMVELPWQTVTKIPPVHAYFAVVKPK